MQNQLLELRDALGNDQQKSLVDPILALVQTDSKVEKNAICLKKISDELHTLLEVQQNNIDTLANLAKSDYNAFLTYIDHQT